MRTTVKDRVTEPEQGTWQAAVLRGRSFAVIRFGNFWQRKNYTRCRTRCHASAIFSVNYL